MFHIILPDQDHVCDLNRSRSWSSLCRYLDLFCRRSFYYTNKLYPSAHKDHIMRSIEVIFAIIDQLKWSWSLHQRSVIFPSSAWWKCCLQRSPRGWWTASPCRSCPASSWRGRWRRRTATWPADINNPGRLSARSLFNQGDQMAQFDAFLYLDCAPCPPTQRNSK